MLTFYFAPGSSSMAAHIALHETGTNFEARPLSFARSENRAPAYLALNPEGKVRPYLGAGVNYTIFWDSKASGGLEKAVGKTDVHMSDSFGWAGQVGVDVDLTPRIFLNLDLKYIDIDTKARLKTAAIGTQNVMVHIDPLVFGAGVGFRF